MCSTKRDCLAIYRILVVVLLLVLVSSPFVVRLIIVREDLCHSAVGRDQGGNRNRRGNLKFSFLTDKAVFSFLRMLQALVTAHCDPSARRYSKDTPLIQHVLLQCPSNPAPYNIFIRAHHMYTVLSWTEKKRPSLACCAHWHRSAKKKKNVAPTGGLYAARVASGDLVLMVVVVESVNGRV